MSIGSVPGNICGCSPKTRKWGVVFVALLGSEFMLLITDWRTRVQGCFVSSHTIAKASFIVLCCLSILPLDWGRHAVCKSCLMLSNFIVSEKTWPVKCVPRSLLTISGSRRKGCQRWSIKPRAASNAVSFRQGTAIRYLEKESRMVRMYLLPSARSIVTKSQ